MTLELRDLENFEQGKALGIEEGKALALEEANNKIIVALLDVLDDEQIAKKTNLPIERIKAVREALREKQL